MFNALRNLSRLILNPPNIRVEIHSIPLINPPPTMNYYPHQDVPRRFYSSNFMHFNDDMLDEGVDALIDELLGVAVQMEDIPIIISENDFSRLPECKYNLEMKQKECSVCLDEFVKDEILKVLPKCNHTFHPKCIGEWLTKQKQLVLFAGLMYEMLD